MISSLEIKLKPGADVDAVKKEMQNIGGKELKVLDRFEQQEDTFKIMQVEKMIAYIFLTFIVIVASFNIIGSLSMLILDKKNDVETLRKLGATDKQIVSIFFIRRSFNCILWCIVGHFAWFIALLAATNIRTCCLGRKQWHLYCERLSR